MQKPIENIDTNLASNHDKTCNFRFHVVSIFPEMFAALTKYGVTARAYTEGHYQLQTYNPRDFSNNRYKKVDDKPFGGGAGMVMMPEPLAACVQHIQNIDGEQLVILLSPQGVLWQQALAQSLMEQQNSNISKEPKPRGITLICGRYEGIDQRFIDNYVDLEISLGEYILTGGELPAMTLLDSLIRLIPNALGNPESIIHESFSEENASKQQFDYPQYTQPRVFENQAVPEVLLNGNHAHIQKWREQAGKEKFKKKSKKI